MENVLQGDKADTAHDITVIRPELRIEDFKIRGRDMAPGRLSSIKKGLLALHTLELMAMTIYKFQISAGHDDEFRRQLVAAMCNEMTHYQDFQVKLYEYGFKPGKWRFLFWIVGFVFGFGSRLMGVKWILKTGVWVETKAVRHYNTLLETIDWDADTRKVIAKDGADEDGHIARWRGLLKNME